MRFWYSTLCQVIVSHQDIMKIENKIKEELAIYISPDEINIYTGLALISCVGRGMVNRKGVSAKFSHPCQEQY